MPGIGEPASLRIVALRGQIADWARRSASCAKAGMDNAIAQPLHANGRSWKWRRADAE
ncbi:hypothetical protein V1282_001141 [Nitrobacteraceae bacterium AZCC 2146]